MCAHLQTIWQGSLEVQQTCGVISVDKGVHFEQLRFPYKIAGSLPEAPENTRLLITQATHQKATYDTIYRLGQRFHSLMLLLLPFKAHNVFCTLYFYSSLYTVIVSNAPVTLTAHTGTFPSFVHHENVFTQLCAFQQFPCSDLARSRPQCD